MVQGVQKYKQRGEDATRRAIRRPPAGGGLRVDNGDKAATGPLMGQRREDGGPRATEAISDQS